MTGFDHIVHDGDMRLGAWSWLCWSAIVCGAAAPRLASADPDPVPVVEHHRLSPAEQSAAENAVLGQDEWDETGVDVGRFLIPDIRELPLAVEQARSVARSRARAEGETEEEAERAASGVPANLETWKSEHQRALEEHAGQAPTDLPPDGAMWPGGRAIARPKRTGLPHIAQGKRVLGWHPYWATLSDIQNYQYSNLTTIAYFSYEVNPTNGNPISAHSWASTPVVEWAHSNGVKVVLTTTMFGSANNQRFLTNSIATSNLITQLLIAMTNRSGSAGDGVCIDFESIGSWSGAQGALTAFMSNLTARFHAANTNYEVSIALPSVDWYASFDVAAYDAFGLDYAIVMGYDYYWAGSSTPGPVAPLYSSAQWIGASSWCSENYSVSHYLDQGIDPAKLLLGVPYYGRRWAAASTNLGAANLGAEYSSALAYGSCKTEAAKWGRRWDNHGSVPYFAYLTNGTAYQCFYDDEVSLGMKYDLANARALGGIGIWNLSQGSGQTELWELIGAKFGANAGEPGEPGGGDGGGSSADAPWVARSSAHSNNYYGVGSREGLHVASGANGALYSSTNGVEWTARSSGASGLLMNVNGDGPLWVVVGESGVILTSSNGTEWISRTSPTNALLRGVAYGNGVYLACGDNGSLLRSTNGIVWTAVSSGTNASLQGIGYGAEFLHSGGTNEATADSPLFTVVGANGLLMTSSNGIAWTKRTSGTTAYLSDVAYGNGFYTAVGNTRTLRSADGVTWSVYTNGSYLYRVVYCAGVFKATGANGTILSSQDGVAWTPETSGTTQTLRGISYAADQFVSVGFNGTILTKGAMGEREGADGGEEDGDPGENGGGAEPLPTPDETGLPQLAASQPAGPLSGVVLFTSGGHGFGANAALTAWISERTLAHAVNEDVGNLDQLNYVAEAAWKAGATVVPFRPVGYQTNEVVLDNMDTNTSPRGRVTFGGTWYNSSQSIYYGNPGDAVPYRYAALSMNGTTAWASYRPTLPAAGDYPVYTWVRHGSDRTNQLYRIYHTGGITDVRVDHSAVGCGWVWLGTYHFAAGTNGSVNISNFVPGGQEGSYVFADAIRFGNGMGTESRGAAGTSGFEFELESSRFWTIKSMGQGMPTSLFDLSGLDDREDNIGQPARMADYMCRTNTHPRWSRIYVGLHSNASGSTNPISRATIGLFDTRIQANYPTLYAAQTNLAAAIARQCNEDMRAGTNSVIPSWSGRTTYLYGSTYGEIYNASVYQKMDTTINEVAFHDNASDAAVLRAPAGREWLARGTVRGIIRHLSGYYASGIANTNAPDRPIRLAAINSGVGALTLSWQMPARTAASGGQPQGYIIYTSTDGRGFGNPIAVSGAATTNKVLTNLNAGATIFFRVCATNAGGESLNSAVAGARVTASGAKAGVLLVAGFDRADNGLSPTRYIAKNLNGNVTLVRPRMINSFDYAKEHALALAAAGQTFDFKDHSLILNSAALTNYAKVIWMLGEESTADKTFDATERAAVAGYLNAGGRLMVSGAEIGWDLGRAGVSTPDEVLFFTNTLRAAYATDNAATGTVTGTTNGFLSGISMDFNYSQLLPDIYAANYPDVLRASSGAVTAAVYGITASGSNGAIIQFSNAVYRTIVMGFPFETITNAAARASLMTKAMQFLGDSAVPAAARVTLTPAAVTNSARWIIAGTTNSSGYTRNGLQAGIYQISFTPVAGYLTPTPTSVVLSAGTTNQFTAEYRAEVETNCIRSQGFDAVDAHPWSWSAIYLGNTGSPTNNSHGAAVVSSTNKTLAGQNAIELQGSTNGAANPTILFENVDISAYTNVTLTIPFAAHGADSGDDLHVAVSFDGGATWLPSAFGTQIADGFSNLKLEYNTFTNLDRQPMGTPYVLAVDDTRTQISVRVTFFDANGANNANDFYYLDEIKLCGQLEAAPDPLLDSDGDGIPDAWEELYFGGPTNATAHADDDGDGASNWDEYIAGTLPLDPLSHLAITAMDPHLTPATDFILRWPSVSGRSYSIWATTNALSAYTQHVGSLPATPPINSFTNPISPDANEQFYEIRVILSP
ncbi:MAG: glycosyl hydrolase family 18 protein [Kiritimatiellae bacterium]|nr:glycosyl hydrolase family 18 protein [Kiritimatiellia bacterium]MCO5067471.1 glycosyl hydrolase family 18 protein [Kiritimatiellia bacterium]